MYVSLSRLPTPPREYAVELPKLDGGLNLWDMEYQVEANQSPDMRNLYWVDGSLTCRAGQSLISPQDSPGTGFGCCAEPFWDHYFLHIGSGLYAVNADAAETASDEVPVELIALMDGVPENRGTWFRYGDDLYYKNRGGYFVVSYDGEKGFSAGAVEGYTPVIKINTEPTTGAGDSYQPENRISPRKTVWYSTVEGVKEYHLPVEDVDGVVEVSVDGEVLEEGTDYTVDLEAGTVTFAAEPIHHDPVRVNTVKITYTKENAETMASVMDCPYAAVYGGNQNVLVVVGGCTAQPNAYFWCGSHTVMDPGYFPVEQYNLAGDTEENITGLGKQQAMLVIFKEKSIGRAEMGMTEMGNGRVLITLDYTAINSRIGCDLPWTIQMVENNLVFCNTESGAYLLKDSTAAYENNVVGISRNVNGGVRRDGLLRAVRSGAVTASLNDGDRYWLVANGEAYVWDFSISGYNKPSWFYFTNIGAVAFFGRREEVYHLDGSGRLSAMRRTCMDYGAGIEKVYQFATQTLGSYDRLKDVTGVIFVVRAESNCLVNITYLTDYEIRRDKTPIRAFAYNLVPRDLTRRYLALNRFAVVARRRPGTRHVRHFAMRLENSEPATDMAVVSAQIFYRYQGRDR